MEKEPKFNQKAWKQCSPEVQAKMMEDFSAEEMDKKLFAEQVQEFL